MKESTKWTLVIIAIIIMGVITYYLKKRKIANAGEKIGTTLNPFNSSISMSNRLKEIGATNEDVSKMDKGFLQEWLGTAEFILSEKGGKITSGHYFMYPPEKAVGMIDPNESPEDRKKRKLYSVLGGKEDK